MSDTFVDSRFLSKNLKKRSPDSRKGQNGSVLVVGGSRQYYGSPALVALAALRAGADLVYLLVPEHIAPTVASYSPDLIVWGYKGEYLNKGATDLFSELREKTDVMVIGNGLTKKSDVLKVAEKMIREYKKPCVIDADAIVAGGYGIKNAVYTPHVKEFERLAGRALPQDFGAQKSLVNSIAENFDSTVLLKGKIDIASDGKIMLLNKTGNSGMTCGGTGDTLAGVCGALLAQKNSALNSAICAAHINGAAGDLAYKKFGNSLIASDIITELPNVLRTI
ncbi:MAG: NAD(P)H-hydrate dehydratase [Nanoarchaeota archaeon]